MAYSDRRRTTVAHIIEQLGWAKERGGPQPAVYLREEGGKLVETRKVTNLLRCEVVGVRNLDNRRGYRVLVVLPDGTERIWGEYSYRDQAMGVQGCTTVWAKHPKEAQS
jgi:hypothetical protein